jgi:hypothetical protein
LFSFIDSSPYTLSSPASLSYADQTLKYLLLEVSSVSEAKRALDLLKIHSFYRVGASYYARVGVYAPSSVGSRILEADMNRLADQGMKPIAATAGQLLSMT